MKTNLFILLISLCLLGSALAGTASHKTATSTQPSTVFDTKENLIRLEAAQKLIDEAALSVKANQTDAAIKQLNDAKKILSQIRSDLSDQVKADKPMYANVRCPILKNPIDISTITPKLTREYKGRKSLFVARDVLKRGISFPTKRKKRNSKRL